ncbi:MAG: Ni/Fe hydrogenase subunit alpha [Dehalococcoidia bacterium]|nr:Ni/Fe hydrogenase subunit alpha [Dehalococcoidia bacterium]
MSTQIDLEELTKIEGHATLRLRVDDGRVEHLEIRSLEGSRYFEGILRGRLYSEASEIATRICGICSCAHCLAAHQAIENALGIVPSAQTHELRRLLNLGESIRSHAAHLYFLALPDYLGVPSTLSIALEQRGAVERAIQLMKLGNDMVRLLAGRDIHPVSVTVGGHLKIPTQEQLTGIRERLEQLRPAAVATAELFNSLPYPELHVKLERFSLYSDSEYALIAGSIRSDEHEFEQRDYGKFVSEYHSPEQTANFVVREGHAYMVGALSRLANSKELLSSDAAALLRAGPVPQGLDNPFLINPAQAIELVQNFDDALAILSNLRPEPEPPPEIWVQAGHGIAAVEAPRGVLWHEYELDDTGHILHANIITPTAQNLRAMEESLAALLPEVVHEGKEAVVAAAEKLIRAYDPCLSCAVHFLNVEWL